MYSSTYAPLQFFALFIPLVYQLVTRGCLQTCCCAIVASVLWYEMLYLHTITEVFLNLLTLHLRCPPGTLASCQRSSANILEDRTIKPTEGRQLRRNPDQPNGGDAYGG